MTKQNRQTVKPPYRILKDAHSKHRTGAESTNSKQGLHNRGMGVKKLKTEPLATELGQKQIFSRIKRKQGQG